MQEGWVISSSTTTEDLINNEKAKDESLDFTVSLQNWRHEACLLEWLIAIENLWVYPSLINNHPWLSKTLDGYSVLSIIFSIISFQSYHILSPKHKLLIPNFPKSWDEIPFKGSSLWHPKIPISECEPLSSMNLNFQKNFIWFKLE
jgi:hypothetical protein